MKKNTQLALTVLTVSLLHIGGIVALSDFGVKNAELIEPPEELTFVELGGGAPAAAPVVEEIKPEPVKPKPEIKRTIVKKPRPDQIVERKPEPKPEPKPEKKPEPKPKPETKPKPEKPAVANANGTPDSKGTDAHGKGTDPNAKGSGSGSGSGGGGGSGSGGGSGNGGPTTGVKIAGSASCLKPDYPQESLDRGETGVVRVRWVVGADGGIISVDVASSSGSKRLDNAALRQARKCRFNPALKGGVPVQNSYSRPYTFKLN